MILATKLKPTFGGVELTIVKRPVLKKTTNTMTMSFKKQSQAERKVEEEKLKELRLAFSLYLVAAKKVKRRTASRQSKHEIAVLNLETLYRDSIDYKSCDELAAVILKNETNLRNTMPGTKDPIYQKSQFLKAELISMAKQYKIKSK